MMRRLFSGAFPSVGSTKGAQDPGIRDAILSRVAWSECFRWDVFSESDLQRFFEDEERLPVIPANKLTLPTRAGTGIEDPFDATSDFIRGRFRFLANPFYHRSRLRASRRDCLLLHAMFFLQIIFEEGEDSVRQDHPGWEVCRDVLSTDRDELRSALSISNYLRNRVLYRMQALWAARISMPFWMDACRRSGLESVIRFVCEEGLLPRYLTEWLAFDEPTAMATGCLLSDGTMRLSETRLNATIQVDVHAEWERVYDHSPAKGLSAYPLPKLGKGQQIVAVSPPINFRWGKTPSGDPWEHVHVEFPVTDLTAILCEKANEDGMGVLALLTASVRPEPNRSGIATSLGYVAPLPASCAVRTLRLRDIPQHFLQARVNFGRLLEVFPKMIVNTNPGMVVEQMALKVFFVIDDE